MLSQKEKINSVKNMLKRDGFTANEIMFSEIDQISDDVLNYLLDSEYDVYIMYKNDLRNSIQESYGDYKTLKEIK